MTTQRLHMPIYPFVEGKLKGGAWPAGISHHGGDVDKQIAAFMRAFNTATKVYR